MLRSQSIPARMVVGYQSNEYSSMTGEYHVRLSHAHAWTEALISTTAASGEPLRYWLRLDPTPGGGGGNEGGGGAGSATTNLQALARGLWEDYVVELNPQRQRSALMTTPGLQPMTASYERTIEQIQTSLAKWDSAGWGSVPVIGFSVTAAIAVIAMAIVAVILTRWTPRRRRRGGEQDVAAAEPHIDYYADTLRLLASRGWRRGRDQTPAAPGRSNQDRFGHAGRYLRRPAGSDRGLLSTTLRGSDHRTGRTNRRLARSIASLESVLAIHRQRHVGGRRHD